MTKLNDWMIANHKSTTDLAEVICRDRTRAHRIRKGALPNKEEAPRICEWTEGAIIMGDFYPASATAVVPKRECKGNSNHMGRLG